jgi:hypothetical protein
MIPCEGIHKYFYFSLPRKKDLGKKKKKIRQTEGTYKAS